mgnify:CR=1 FL=1
MSIRGEKTFCDPGERQSRRNVSAGKLICWGMEKDFIHSRPGIQGGGAIGGNSFELEGCIDRMQLFYWKFQHRFKEETKMASLPMPLNSAGMSPSSAASAFSPAS